jgi:uncharacterized membrane protein
MIFKHYIYPKEILTKFFILLLLLNFSISYSQTGVPFNQRDDTYPLLGLKRAKAGYEASKFEYEQKQKLFSEDLISEKELILAKNKYADAEVNYQQSLLSVLFEKQYVSVSKAVKYQAKNGKKQVRLTLVNTSGSAEFKKLIQVEDELFRALQPDIINDIYVSLLNNDNAIISQPYEIKIEKLVFGKPADLTFTLLQDLDVVTVNLVYSNGTQRSPKIFLEKDASVNQVLIQSEQFSQVVELGGSATFDFSLELFSGENNTYKLETANLPSQINRYFIDPESKARLSQFKFAEQMSSRKAGLQVYMPDRPGEEVLMDLPIQFYVLAIPKDRVAEFKDIKTHQWTDKEIQDLKIGYVKLELIPRGIGKLLVRAPQLFHSIQPDQQVSVKIQLVNEGSRRLDNIEIEVNTPFNWRKEILPSLISKLDIDEEKTIELKLFPSDDVAIGRYEIRMRSSSLSDDLPVSGEDKTITVEILPETNIAGTTILILFIVGIIIGIVLFGLKLTRK